MFIMGVTIVQFLSLTVLIATPEKIATSIREGAMEFSTPFPVDCQMAQSVLGVVRCDLASSPVGA
jgi:hypothetical protein